MNKIIYTMLLLAFLSSANGDEIDCSMLDSRLLSCPWPESPRVTELSEGFVKLRFTVDKSGTTKDIVIVEYLGDERWYRASIEAIEQWKYSVADRLENKEQVFEFKFTDR